MDEIAALVSSSSFSVVPSGVWGEAEDFGSNLYACIQTELLVLISTTLSHADQGRKLERAACYLLLLVRFWTILSLVRKRA